MTDDVLSESDLFIDFKFPEKEENSVSEEFLSNF